MVGAVRIAHVLQRIALVTLAYGSLGAASLLLAVAPGYASPLFPSAGLALACTLQFGRVALVGVWLGSALLNLSNAWLSGSPDAVSLSVAVLVGFSAAIQAAAGAWMIDRFLGERWRSLESEQEVARFLLLGGLIATLVSSSLAVTGLYGLGVIDRSDYLFAWWNWYVGDSVGVIVLAPLAVCFFERRRGAWKERWRRIVGPTLVTGGLVALAFHGVALWERQVQQNRLQADGQALARRIADRVLAHREVLASLRNFIEATPEFSFRQFEQFTRITLQGHEDIHALSFNDLVPHEHREAYEKSLGAGFQITERDASGRLRRADDRPDYVAVRYIVPLAANRPAVGFDIYSEPIRREAIDRALALGGVAVTMPVKLVQDQQKRTGVLELLPVRGGANPLAVDGLARPGGFAVAVIKVDEMVAIATREQVPEGLALQLTDAGMPAGEGVLYRSASLLAGEVVPERASGWSVLLPVGDRKWALSAFPGRGYFQHNRPVLVWAMGGIGLLFAVLMQVLILGMSGRTALIQRNNAALRASEDRYQRLFNDSPLPMWQIATGSRRFLMVNDKAVAHYGWSREAFLAMTLDDILVAGEALAGWDAGAGQAAVLPRCRHRRRDGSEIEVIVSASGLAWGEDEACVQVIQDITQHIQLIAAREAAEQSSQTKSRFLATVSHELRTPMNGILGMAQLLLRPDVSAPDRQDYARVILDSGQVLLGQLNDILDFSKVEAGKLTLNPAPVRVAGVLQDVLGLFAEPARRKGLALTAGWAGADDGAYCLDRQRLVQMLANLVGNAIKFTDAGSVHVEARVVARDGDGAVLEFAVTDTGIGVPEDKHPAMFLPFSQTDSSASRRYGGTGLGLSIVRSLAELMGGSVGLVSRVGEGARFWFRIHAAADDARPRPEAPERPAAHLPAPLSTGGLVMLVEDNPTNRRVIRSQLAALGVGVLDVADGQACLDRLAGGARPDLVLMDVQMPVMDGLATTAEIRRREAGSGQRLPIVALTADAFAESRTACLAAGMDDFVTKPVLMEVLVGVLQRWLPSAPEGMPPPPSLQTLDGDRLAALAEELDQLLVQNDFDALARFRELKTLVFGTVMESDFDEVGRLVGELRFMAARECLQQVLARSPGAAG